MAEGHDDVRRSFADQSDLFSGADSPFATRDETTLSWLEPLSDDMVVLDVACGAGHAAELAAPHVREVVGIDLTRTLLDLGAERLGVSGVTNVLLQEGNAAALPFVDASFDLVFCRSALHHMTDPEQVLAEMARVCRPGGRVVVEDMTPPSADVRDQFDVLHRPSILRTRTSWSMASFSPSCAVTSARWSIPSNRRSPIPSRQLGSPTP